MTKVLFTVDVEVWCDGWDRLDEHFPAALARYIYGRTPAGDYGLPFTLRALTEHGLSGVFFVEALFATRFGPSALEEIVQMIQHAGQEVQLHLHPEWVDEAPATLLPTSSVKQPFLFGFSLADQTHLIKIGKALLQNAGAPAVTAFRSGNYAINRNTLRALRLNGITFDLSYNHTYAFPGNDLLPEAGLLLQPIEIEQVFEYPVTFFEDRPHHHRHLQLGSCSFEEMRDVLWYASAHLWDSVVIVSHSFELMNQQKTRPDKVVVDRFLKLCAFLENNRDSFDTVGLRTMVPLSCAEQPQPPR